MWKIVTVTSFCVLVVGGALALWLWQGTATPVPDTPTTLISKAAELAPLQVLVIEADTNQPRALLCEAESCVVQSRPEQPEALTDGTWWYSYDTQKNSRGQDSAVLFRDHINTDQHETVMAESPLTKPRDLFISPSGKQAGFFLDNIDDPAKQLTELWVFDTEHGRVRLVAEKLYIPDIRSQVHWNASGNYLWFIADNGNQKSTDETLQLVVVDTIDPAARVIFPDIDWSDAVTRIDSSPLDMTADGRRLARSTRSLLGQSILEVRIEGQDPQRTFIRGTIPYLRFLPDASLLYTVQDRSGVAFWRLNDGVHRLLAKRSGQLQSTHSDETGEYVAFSLASPQAAFSQLFALHVASGQLAIVASLPASQVPQHVIQVNQLPETTDTVTESTVESFDDGEIAAFISANLADITGITDPVPLSFVVTDQHNTVFVEYRDGDADIRLLVTIRNAIHADWTIRARYEAVNSQWRKIAGGSAPDPAPKRLYEWESALKQWILKQAID